MTTKVMWLSAQDIAECLGVCDSTYRCFATVSRPIGLQYIRVPGDFGKPFRGFLLKPTIEWLKQSCPEKITSDVEASLYATAAKNMQKMETT